MPAILPKKKILSIDIGGTLAKVAFYVPKDDPSFKEPEFQEKLTKETIPSKNFKERSVSKVVCSRTSKR